MDVYGLGTALYYMLVGEHYNTLDEIKEDDQHQIIFHITQNYPDALNLIEGMIVADPDKRFTLQ